ncbi:uncharacterized protein LOC143933353 [Lithobates pipiens]
MRITNILLIVTLALIAVCQAHPGGHEDECEHPHQVWNSCGTACPDNCQNYRDVNRPCAKICGRGCFCRKPYVFKNGDSGPCTHWKLCPRTYTEYYEHYKEKSYNFTNFQNGERLLLQLGLISQDVDHDQMETLSSFSKRPPPTSSLPPLWMKQKSKRHPLHSFGVDGSIPQCKHPNQVWSSCGTACPDNCQNYRDVNRPCITMCVPGCFCRKPYIFQNGKSGPCTHFRSCPRT